MSTLRGERSQRDHEVWRVKDLYMVECEESRQPDLGLQREGAVGNNDWFEIWGLMKSSLMYRPFQNLRVVKDQKVAVSRIFAREVRNEFPRVRAYTGNLREYPTGIDRDIHGVLEIRRDDCQDKRAISCGAYPASLAKPVSAILAAPIALVS